jgi:hypothetical protein
MAEIPAHERLLAMMMVCGMVVIGITGHALRLVASGAGVDFFFLRPIEPEVEKKSQGAARIPNCG